MRQLGSGFYVISFLLLILSNYESKAQTSSWYFNELNQGKGLSEQTNPELYKDSRGFLWITSFDGLNRFDGKTVKVYKPVIPEVGLDAYITSNIFEDQRGDLWFSTIGGIHHLNRASDTISSRILSGNFSGDAAKNHHAIHLDQNGELWVVADSVLHLVNIYNGEDTILHPYSAYMAYAVTNQDKKVTHLVKPLLEEPAGIEVLTYSQDTLTIDRERFFVENDERGFPEAVIFFILIENDSTIWLPSNIGLIRFNPNRPTAYDLFRPENHQGSSSFCDAGSWGDTLLWIASSRYGLYLFDKKELQFVRRYTLAWINDRSTPLNRVNNLYIDKQENLWLSIWGERLIFTNLPNSKFSSLLSKAGYSSSGSTSITSIIQDEDRQIWATGGRQEAFVFENDPTARTWKNTLSLVEKEDQFRASSFLFCDNEGDIWGLSYSSMMIWRKDENKIERIDAPVSKYRKIIQIDTRKFLLLTYEGIYEIEKLKTGFSFSQKISFDELTEYTQLFFSQNGLLLIAGVNDLFFYQIEERAFRFLKQVENIGLVHGMAEEKDCFWFSSNRGLLKVDKSDYSLRLIQDKNQLLSRSFNGLLMDEKGEIWLSSNNGIFHYNPKTKAAQHFTQSDGLRNTQFNLASQFKDANGKLYFGGTNGITYFDPNEIKLNQNLPIVQLTEVLVNSSDTLKGYDLSKVEELIFPYTDNTLSFNFVSIEYSAPHENQHAYFLEGYDKDTVNTDTRGFAHYPNLPYGRYRLRLMGSNSDGVWAPEPRELEIIILRPWYHTWWFRITALLSFLFLVYWLYRGEIKRIKEREAIKRKEAEFKLKEAELREKAVQAKQEVTEHKMALLRLQMNPHFFSNSLSAIGHYILDEAPRKAYDFLQHFSTLMRGVLEIAAHSYIPIQEEIELLTSFLAIKSLELAEEKLSWEIEVDQTLDQDVVLVPTMLLQPIVENAIEHGIAPKKDKGLIQIAFKRDQGKLICTVHDDGVGRMASAQLREANGPKSKAMAITLDRLRLLQIETGEVASMEVIDLQADDGTALGTRVVLTLPLKE